MFNSAHKFAIHGGFFNSNNNYYNDTVQHQGNLNKLNPIVKASFKYDRHSSCLEGTCTGILDKLMEWAKDPHSEPIFWLSGIAGTGKSTIAQSFCERLQDHDLLGASFFCSRESENLRQVRQILPTLAYFLAQGFGEYYDQIALALQGDPTLASQGIRRQLEYLFMHPLKNMTKSKWHCILVIDALDECEDIDAIQNILSILGDIPTHVYAHVHIFISCRPEYHIEKEFERSLKKNLLKHHDMESEIVQKDIQLYLKSALHNISENDITHLAEQAGRLFIYAFIQVQYLKKAPGEVAMQSRLNELLGNSLRGITKPVDGLYNTLLRKSGEHMEIQEKEDAKYFINIIVSLSDPLSQQALSELWRPCDIGPFRSVLNIPGSKETPIHIFHASFSDYILDQGRCLTEFYCNPQEIHQIMTLACMRFMHRNLKHNTCNMQTDDHVSLFSERMISPALQYSCKHWIFHLTRCGSLKKDILIEMEKFVRNSFLFWIEDMCVLNSIEHAIPGLQSVSNWLRTYNNESTVTEFLELVIYEGRRFLQLIVNLIKDYPLQLYYSGIAWLPRLSVLDKIQGIPQNVPKVLHGLQSIWDMCEVTIRCSGEIQCIELSPDGTQVVTGSNHNTVDVWDVTTGRQIQELEGHFDSVSSVAFSPDGRQVVSGSIDNTIRIWNIVTGKQIKELAGHSAVNSVAFSPDGKQVVAASDDETVRIWDTATCKQIQQLKGHSGWVRSVAFSPDGEKVVSGSADKKIRIWNLATGERIQKLEGHAWAVNAVAFSPDGKQVVSGSNDGTVRIWSIANGKQTQQLEGHSCCVRSVALSPVGEQVVSGSDDETVRIWNVATGKQVYRFKGHSGGVNSVSFSSDGKQVVSGSTDTTVRLWNVATGQQIPKAQGHCRFVNSVAFSQDGEQMVSGSNDCTVRIWNVATAQQVQKLDTHFSLVQSVAFSPDGKQVVSGSSDGTVHIWNGTTGKQIQKLEAHYVWINSVAFSSDGAQVVSRSDHNTICIWNVATGMQISTIDDSSLTISSPSPIPAFFQGGFICLPGSLNFWILPQYQDLKVMDQHDNSTLCFGCASGAIVIIHMSARLSKLQSDEPIDSSSSINHDGKF